MTAPGPKDGATEWVLTLSCADRPGIVAAVAGTLAGMGANISESAQYWDRAVNRFFLRIAFLVPPGRDRAAVDAALAPVIRDFEMSHALADLGRRPRFLVMVSKFDHALLHLLYQIRVGWLEADLVAIVSNHADSRATAEASGIPFHHLPVTAATKPEQEARLLRIVRETGAELVVLARYMQVLSDDLCRALEGRVINIHHSFLPSFKGAHPYRQAYDRGVKLIGATAHYVTADLDEGPIIEQETERVTHGETVEDYVATGRDIEARVLARAVKLHLERRVLLSGQRTIVFRR
jgi:formyltetrahydrofolate deformylase